jgi:hypothetical protein
MRKGRSNARSSICAALSVLIYAVLHERRQAKPPTGALWRGRYFICRYQWADESSLRGMTMPAVRITHPTRRKSAVVACMSSNRAGRAASGGTKKDRPQADTLRRELRLSRHRRPPRADDFLHLLTAVDPVERRKNASASMVNGWSGGIGHCGWKPWGERGSISPTRR